MALFAALRFMMSPPQRRHAIQLEHEIRECRLSRFAGKVRPTLQPHLQPLLHQLLRLGTVDLPGIATHRNLPIEGKHVIIDHIAANQLYTQLPRRSATATRLNSPLATRADSVCASSYSRCDGGTATGREMLPAALATEATPRIRTAHPKQKRP
ncbi:hypothetical protein ACFSQE_05975 [Vogesella fluminis]|uniref:hypothetical protein n=1 Tax=Vogesella fluminis TaxID=1069161 RepID=UPI00363D2306